MSSIDISNDQRDIKIPQDILADLADLILPRTKTCPYSVLARSRERCNEAMSDRNRIHGFTRVKNQKVPLIDNDQVRFRK